MDNRNGGSDGSCHYKVLGIGKDASLSDVRAAYHKLALKWHPDRLTKEDPSLAGGGEINRRFQRIQEAYSVLSDQRKRSMYDAGTLHLFDQDDDEGMGEFMHDLLKMMDNNNRVGEVWKEESLEDLQRCFMETFGASYHHFTTTTTTTTVVQNHPKTTTSTTNHNTTSSRSPYARPPPKTYRKTNRRTNSSTTTSS